MKLYQQLSRNYVVRCLLLIVAYYIAGRTSLLLAISDGFASPVWPAAGIALGVLLLGGARYAPAIFAAAFVTNLMIAVEGGASVLDGTSLILATSIGVGATLQALSALMLIKRVARLDDLLDSDRDVAMLFALGGPVSCVICASFGVGALYYVGFVSADQLLFTWSTWWVGDTIGVLTATPATILLFSPRFLANRKLLVLIPSAMVLTALIVLFSMSRDREQQALVDKFAAFVQTPVTLARNQIVILEEALWSLRGYFEADKTIDQEAFGVLTRGVLTRRKQVGALYWGPRVTDAQRSAMDALLQREGWSELGIMDPSDTGFMTATQRPEYFPMLYCETLTDVRCVYGLDLYGLEEFRPVFDDARDAGTTIATHPFLLPLRENNERGYFVILAVYADHNAVDTVEERRRKLRGFLFSIVRMNDFVHEITTPGLLRNAQLYVYDNYIRGDAATIFNHRVVDAPFRHQEVVEISGRQWTLEFTPTTLFLQEQRSWGTWMVLIGGLVVVSLIQLFLLSLTARTETIRRMVDEKTAQLRESNKELERFAYVCSHDLQEPLRTISSFADRLQMQFEKLDIEDGASQKMLFYLREGADRAQHLITDVLAYSGIDQDRNKPEWIALEDLVQIVRDTLSENLRASCGSITSDGLPRVFGIRIRLTQLLQNLISNGLKYQAEGQVPRVHLSSRDLGEFWEIAVEDNGIGISAANTERIFDVFQRLHRNEEYSGTGVGLSICKKVVQLHGGRIWVESETGQGSTFRFTLAKQPEFD